LNKQLEKKELKNLLFQLKSQAEWNWKYQKNNLGGFVISGVREIAESEGKSGGERKFGG
jgi:hypothetical protein